MTKEKLFAINVYESETLEFYEEVNFLAESMIESIEHGNDLTELKKRKYHLHERVRNIINTENVIGLLTLKDEVKTHIFEFPVLANGTFYDIFLPKEEGSMVYIHLEDGTKIEGVVEV